MDNVYIVSNLKINIFNIKSFRFLTHIVGMYNQLKCIILTP